MHITTSYFLPVLLISGLTFILSVGAQRTGQLVSYAAHVTSCRSLCSCCGGGLASPSLRPTRAHFLLLVLSQLSIHVSRPCLSQATQTSVIDTVRALQCVFFPALTTVIIDYFFHYYFKIISPP